MKSDGELNKETIHQPVQYLYNIIEQDHRFKKWRIKPMLGLFSFMTANWILQGIEAMHMIKKIQIKDFFEMYKNDMLHNGTCFNCDTCGSTTGFS